MNVIKVVHVQGNDLEDMFGNIISEILGTHQVSAEELTEVFGRLTTKLLFTTCLGTDKTHQGKCLDALCVGLREAFTECQGQEQDILAEVDAMDRVQ